MTKAGEILIKSMVVLIVMNQCCFLSFDNRTTRVGKMLTLGEAGGRAWGIFHY